MCPGCRRLFSTIQPQAVLCLLLTSLPPAVQAIEAIELSLGRIEGNGWSAEGGVLSLTLGRSRGLKLQVDNLSLLPPLGAIRGLTLDCPQLSLEPGQLGCSDGIVELKSDLLQQPPVLVDFNIDRQRRFTWSVHEARFARGRLSLHGEVAEGRWWLALNGAGFDVAEATRRLAGLVPMPQTLSLAGTGDLALRLSGTRTPTAVRLETHLKDFAFADEHGLREGAELELRCAARGDEQPAGLAFSGACDVDTGQVYLDPVYLEVGDQPLHLAARGQWKAPLRRLEIERFDFRHPDVVHGHGRAVAAGKDGLSLEALQADFDTAHLGRLYPVYLQPWIWDGLLQLESEGRVAGRVRWKHGRLTDLALALDDVHLDDEEGRLGLYGLTGSLNWSSGLEVDTSRVRWSAGHLYKLQLGETEVEALARGGHLSLTRRAAVPVLDGVLSVDALQLDGLGTEQPSWRFEGLLSPLSMESLSQVLGWPALGGTLSGVVPSVSYADGRISIQGALLVRVLGGEVVIHGLSMENPLGIVPTLEADMDIRNLSLEQLTGAFSFGNIQGRLGGEVRRLRLEDWQPVRFDARFYTPPGDRSRRRISQRAVENLASLGGAGGALSRTFMGFFKEFSYRRLGIACRLRKGICEMDGVAPAEQGYYIVKGGGIPRIDVVGYNRRVDWDTLIQRLKNVTNAAAPIVR